VQLGNSPEGNTKHFQTLKYFTPYLLCYFVSYFVLARPNSTSTADSTQAYEGFSLLYATTT
jgi:hypothetical protein